MDLFALCGRRREYFHEVEQAFGANVAQPRSNENGEDAVFANRFVQRGDEVLFCQGALGEELLHEFIFTFRNKLNERVMSSFDLVRDFRRDRNLFALPFSAQIELERLHRDQIDDPREAAFFAYGQLHRHTSSTKRGLD